MYRVILDSLTHTILGILETFTEYPYYAIKREKMTVDEAHQFIQTVREKGSKLPDTDFNIFISPVVI